MSVDLFVVRNMAISWDDCLRACDVLRQQHGGLTFWTMERDGTGTSAYFWHVDRVSLSAVIPDAEDHAEDPSELAHPYIVVSSRSVAWPWIEWTAMELAKALGARVYDPQNGDFHDQSAPEHDIASLHRMHNSWLREVNPTLMCSYWATDAGDASPAGLRAQIPAFQAAAREALGVDVVLALKSENQISLWHSLDVTNSRIHFSTSGGSIYEKNPKRTVHVSGPVSDGRVSTFADAVASHLNIQFRSINEYK